MKKRHFAVAALAIGVLFILYGAFSEQIATVFRKAVAICLECIGIG